MSCHRCNLPNPIPRSFLARIAAERSTKRRRSVTYRGARTLRRSLNFKSEVSESLHHLQREGLKDEGAFDSSDSSLRDAITTLPIRIRTCIIHQ